MTHPQPPTRCAHWHQQGAPLGSECRKCIWRSVPGCSALGLGPSLPVSALQKPGGESCRIQLGSTGVRCTGKGSPRQRLGGARWAPRSQGVRGSNPCGGSLQTQGRWSSWTSPPSTVSTPYFPLPHAVCEPETRMPASQTGDITFAQAAAHQMFPLPCSRSRAEAVEAFPREHLRLSPATPGPSSLLRS